MDEVPAELVINWEKTGLNYLPVSQWTTEQEGAKRVELDRKDDKRQIRNCSFLDALCQVTSSSPT